MHKTSPPEDVSSSAFPLGSNSEGWQSSSLQSPHSGPHDPPEAKNPAERPLESLLCCLRSWHLGTEALTFREKPRGWLSLEGLAPPGPHPYWKRPSQATQQRQAVRSRPAGARTGQSISRVPLCHHLISFFLLFPQMKPNPGKRGLGRDAFPLKGKRRAPRKGGPRLVYASPGSGPSQPLLQSARSSGSSS